MTISTKLYVVRHGESTLNKQGIVTGQLNPALTDKGRKQALETKSKLKNIAFYTVYTSDLDRSIETAEIICGKSIPKDHRLTNLREQYLGSLQGRPLKDLIEAEKTKKTMPRAASWTFKYIPDMESDNEVASRFTTALEGIAKNHPGKTILIVAHSGAIRATLRKLQNLSQNDLPVGSFRNAGYAEVVYKDDSFKVVRVIGLKI